MNQVVIKYHLHFINNKIAMFQERNMAIFGLI